MAAWACSETAHAASVKPQQFARTGFVFRCRFKNCQSYFDLLYSNDRKQLAELRRAWELVLCTQPGNQNLAKDPEGKGIWHKCGFAGISRTLLFFLRNSCNLMKSIGKPSITFASIGETFKSTHQQSSCCADEVLASAAAMAASSADVSAALMSQAGDEDAAARARSTGAAANPWP